MGSNLAYNRCLWGGHLYLGHGWIFKYLYCFVWHAQHRRNTSLGLNNVCNSIGYFIINFNLIADIACEETVLTERLHKVRASVRLLVTFRVLFNIVHIYVLYVN